MSEFQELKEECKKLLEDVSKLYTDVCEEIYFKDIHILEQEYPDHITKNDEGDFLLDEKIIINVVRGNLGESILQFEDRRKEMFLWVFTAEIEGLRTNDYFIEKKRIESVKHLHEGQYSNIEDRIKTVRDELADTLNKLRSKPDINALKYKYVCVKPDVECEDIKSVAKKVLYREWV